MIIGLHDADADRFKANHSDKFPNLALMKLSAYHKARGDTVDGSCHWNATNTMSCIPARSSTSHPTIHTSPKTPSRVERDTAYTTSFRPK